MKKLLFWIMIPAILFAAQLQNTIPVVVRSTEAEEPAIKSVQPVKPEVINGVYQISNAAELFWFADSTNSGKTGANALNAVLTADIDIEGEYWVPIAVGDGGTTYTGTFDGQGHTISNLVVNTEWLYNKYRDEGMSVANAKLMIQNSGFIGSLKGTVKNITLENVTVYSNANGGLKQANPTQAQMIEKPISVGAIVGWISGDGVGGTVDNVTVSGNLEAEGTGVALGGIVGNAGGGKIINSTSLVIIRSETDTSTVYIGGITGYTKNNPRFENDAWLGEIIINAGHGTSGGVTGYVYSGTVTVDNVTYNKEGVESAIGTSCTKCAGSGDMDYGIYKIYNVGKKKVCEIDGAYKNSVASGIFTVKANVDSVIFNRTFNMAGKNTSTIVLPFNISRDNIEGADFYKLGSVVKDESGYKVYLDIEAGDIVANKPYIIKPTAEHITIKGSYTLNAAMADSSVDGDWTLRSIYNYTTGTDLGDRRTKTYGFVAKDTVIDGKEWTAGQFAKMGQRAFTYPFRVLLEFTGEEISALMKSANISAGDIPETLDVVFPDGTTVVAKELKPLIAEPRAMLKYDRMNNRIDVIRNGKKYSITGKSVR